MKCRILLLVLIFCPAFCCFVDGEIFSLRNGGAVQGIIETSPQMEQKRWTVKTKEGILLELEHKNPVARIYKDVSKEQTSYENAAPFYENNVENHLKLAKLCKTYKMDSLSAMHFRQVIELDPEQGEARKALGYTKINGDWLTREEERSNMGYVYKDRHWITAERAAIEEGKLQQKNENGELRKRVSKIAEGLHGRNVKAAANELYALNDPAAVGPIVELLQKEPDADLRIIYLKALEKAETVEAFSALADVSMNDRVPEVAYTALELLRPHPGVTRYFTRFLRSPDNSTINKSAAALGKLNDKAATLELINALVTQHSETKLLGSGGYDVGFNNRGNTGFTTGQKTVVEHKELKNTDVLKALKKITSEDFGYDTNRWLDWYRGQRRVGNYNSRRGGVD
ncbi:MAG: hypothetical protein LBQ54_02455 [Planctomycetaceae bacterium]|jgi:hypothetical protein|nr:hypothetical protein [Planctomycetaceae bacterium]